VFLLAGVTDFMSSFQVIGDDLKVIIRLVWLFYLNPALERVRDGKLTRNVQSERLFAGFAGLDRLGFFIQRFHL
jgi:hypothetical protein